MCNLPGVTNYIIVADNPLLRCTNTLACTLAAWVKASSPQINGAGILAKGNGNREEYSLDVNANLFRTYVRNTNAVNTTLPSTLAVNASWQHVAGVYDGIGKTLKIYTNGQLSASTTGSGNNLLSLMTTNNHEISIA